MNIFNKNKLKVVEIKPEECITTTIYNPSPHRLSDGECPVSERKKPIVYFCENCDYSISFKPDDFEKHNNSIYSNLDSKDKRAFDKGVKKHISKKMSFLDFYCPHCKQATLFLFSGGASGYWGIYEFKINLILVLESSKGV